MKKFLLTLVLIILTASTQAQTKKDVVNWAIATEPPITYEANGEFKGYGVEYIKMIQAELPQYSHKIYSAGNYKRLSKDVVDGPLTAAIGLFKTDERLQVMHFAKVPVFYFFDIQLAMRLETYEDLKEPDKLSLDSLLKNSKFVLGVSSGRKFSDNIDNLLEKDDYQTKINRVTQGNVTQSLVHMLDAKRIDFTLLYPEEASYLAQDNKLKNKIVTVSLKEVNQLSYSWPVVTKNPKGEKLAMEITEALIKVRQKKEFRDLYKSWISKNNHKVYDEKFVKEFLKVYEK